MTLTILAFVAAIIAGFFVVAGVSGAVWVPARSKDTLAILKQLQVTQQSTIAEFGCGDGRNITYLLKTPAHRVDGYEINPIMWLIAKIRVGGTKRSAVRLADGWSVDFSKYDIVLVFLMPKVMQKLSTKLQKELRPGSYVVSYTFELPDMELAFKQHNYFVYIVR